ncbi:YbaB/EbfC family nucleoid-associated protein [Fodinicola acaciae]|uniref:YbaB/EbfC family nucleoid-associated protein n=1 Tax=Fodinicola acaciae TaxID=2681555 RepID=UPI0013D241BF|nr:YbaB/EbfC family nucleoid-associated protein [Fodinicola acaciae]
MLDDPHRVARLRRLAENVRAIRDGVDRVETVADSPDGRIRARVGGRGDLIGLEVDDRVFRQPDSARLAAEIAATVRTAQQAADREIARICTETFPSH